MFLKEEELYLIIYFVSVIRIHRKIKNLFHEDCMVGEEYNHYYLELREEYQENLCPCYFFWFSLFPSIYLKFLFPFPLIFYFEIFVHSLEQYILNFLLKCFLRHVNLVVVILLISSPSACSSPNTSPSCIFVIIFIIIINNFI